MATYSVRTKGTSNKQMPLRFTLSSQHGLTPLAEPEEEYFPTMCGKCDQDIMETSEGCVQAVICDVCKTFYHQQCGGLSDELFDIVTRFGVQGTQEIPWHCNICRKYAKGMIDDMINLKRRQDKLEKEMNVVKEQLSGVKDTKGVNDTDLHKAVKEVLEQEKRQLNIVVSNLPGISSTSTPNSVLESTRVLFKNKLQVRPSDIDRTDIIPTERGTFVKVQTI